MRYAIRVVLDDSGKFFHVKTYIWLASQGVWSPTLPIVTNDLPDYKILDDLWFRCAASSVSIQKFEAKGVELQFEDDDVRLMWDYIKGVDMLAAVAAANVADFKTAGAVKELPDVAYGALSPYQKIGLTNAMQLPGYGLFMKQGTGKTAVAIMAICNDAMKRHKEKYRAIVVCPPNVRTNWQREFQKFAPIDVATQILRGTQVARMSQVLAMLQDPSPVGVLICNYETLQHSWDVLGMMRFDYAVLDEAHYIKDVRTKRFHYAQLLRQNSARRLVLTGTPIANTLLDLYAMFEFIGPGSSGFATYDGFKKFFSRFKETQHGDKFDSAQNLPILKERLAKYSYHVTKEEALPYLPDKNYDVIEVEMPPPHAEAYEKLRDELVIDIESTLENTENEAVAVNNILTMLLRLSQITSSFKVIPAVYDIDGAVVNPRTVIPFAENIKVDAVLQLLPEKQPHEKTIVWSNWIEDILALKKALESAGESPVVFYGDSSFDDRLEAERRFNEDPTCRWFIGNPAAGGAGLNLLGYPPENPEIQTNCTHVVYMSQNWSMILREQSEDRAHRRGTREPVRISEIVCPGTIDTIIAQRVWGKRLNASSVLDVKEILDELKRLI